VAKINSLLFVKELPEPRPDGGSRTFWAPDCAGLDYTAACDLGHDLALEAVQYMRAENMAGLLAWAVMEMPRHAGTDEAGRGAMVGFLTTLARLAMDAATPARLAGYERSHAAWQAYWRRLVAEEATRERARKRRRARRTAP
jgi:hypothetical protein